jgi:hypothetical protein
MSIDLSDYEGLLSGFTEIDFESFELEDDPIQAANLHLLEVSVSNGDWLSGQIKDDFNCSQADLRRECVKLAYRILEESLESWGPWVAYREKEEMLELPMPEGKGRRTGP